MRHKTKLIGFVIILMAFFFFSGCDSPDFDDDSGSVTPDSDDDAGSVTPDPADDNAEESPFEIDDLFIGGTGCRYEDTYKVELSRDDEGDTITFEFSAFNSTSDEENEWSPSYCDITIPIKVPAGMSVGLAGMDHEGAAYIPSGGTGKLHWEQYFSTNIEPTYDFFITTYDEHHEFSYKNTAPVLWSECGKDWANASFYTSIIALRELDSSVQAQEHVSKMKLYLKWKECE